MMIRRMHSVQAKVFIVVVRVGEEDAVRLGTRWPGACGRVGSIVIVALKAASACWVVALHSVQPLTYARSAGTFARTSVAWHLTPQQEHAGPHVHLCAR